MEKVRIGIIGVGSQGSSYLKNIFNEKKIPNGIVTAVCDIDPVRIENAKEYLKGQEISYFDNYQEMILSGKVDAVLVEIPHYLHPETVIFALEHGVCALCEKPAGVYTKQVKEMNAVAKKSNQIFMMMFNQRTNCVYRKMRELIQGGELGTIRRINWIITDWFRSQYYYNSSSWRATWKGEGGGVLINQCPHQLDLIQWVTGLMPSSVRSFMSFGKYHDIEVEDEVTTYMEYDNGATGLFVTTTAEGSGTNRFEVVGDYGKIVCENNRLFFTKQEVATSEFLKTATEMFSAPKGTTFEVETDGENPQHTGIINNFVNSILGLEKPFVNGEEGLYGVELMDAMLLSGFYGGKKVSLPINDDEYLEVLNQKVKESQK